MQWTKWRTCSERSKGLTKLVQMKWLKTWVNEKNSQKNEIEETLIRLLQIKQSKSSEQNKGNWNWKSLAEDDMYYLEINVIS